MSGAQRLSEWALCDHAAVQITASVEDARADVDGPLRPLTKSSGCYNAARQTGHSPHIKTNQMSQII